ncbi:hypothetical protein [Undibacterium sp. Di24W]|uniref:ORC-CDC6 family AAA ATPase n=1 Tax=Undibacterium sp. Di24W TaxID=3413033 RepID=UPI003BF1B7D6
MSSDFYLRTESIKTEDILDLFVESNEDSQIIKALCSSEPCILEGSRGTGKSFLMRVAQKEVESSAKTNVAVFVSFNISSLIGTGDSHQFYHWMLAKALRALMVSLKKKGFDISPFSSGLLSRDEFSSEKDIQQNLESIIKIYEESYKGGINVDIGLLPDIEDVKEALQDICETNAIDRIYFFFDEAAHVFRPEQQRQFFSLFKDFRSPYVTCNAAIYPGVTYFGDSFEPIHDCIYKTIERNIRDQGYLDYFQEMVFKQCDPAHKKILETNAELFNTLMLSGGGNPRMILKTVQDLLSQKFNTTSVEQVIKEFYRNKIWSEHTYLGDKYQGHKTLIDWGREFLEKTVIPNIQLLNERRQAKGASESSIYFWIHKDAPETVKEALRLLTYTGIIRKTDSGVRATRAELGTRYEVKYGCIISLYANPNKESKEFYKSLSLNKYPEFGKSHSSYSPILELVNTIENDVEFRRSVKEMMKRPIEVLAILSQWKIGQLKSANIHTIEDLYDRTESDLIEQIYGVGPAKARIIKNAVSAELLEYLSG